MANVLLCVELPGQIPAALEAANKTGETDWKILALTPHVEYALEKLSQPFVRPEAYHSETEIHQVGLDDLDRLENFCGTVDSLLKSDWGLLREHDLGPASLNWYYLKTLFNCISIRAFILGRVLDSEQPRQVMYFSTREAPVARDLFFVRESVWSKVIPFVCSASNTPHEEMGGNTDPTVLNRYPKAHGSGIAGDVKRLGRTMLGPSRVRTLKDAVAGVSRFKRRLSPSHHQNGKSEAPFVLALENAYSLGLLLQEVESRGSFAVAHWDDYKNTRSPQEMNGEGTRSDELSGEEDSSLKTLQEKGRKFWAETRGLPEFRQLLMVNGVDWFAVIESRMRRFFEVEVPQLVHTYLSSRALLRNRRPVAVLAATMGDHERHVVALAARKEEIPFVIYRHGSTSGHVMMESWPNELHKHNELWAADFVLTFGQGDVDYLEKCDGPKASIVPIGSAALDRLKQAAPSTDTKILLGGWAFDRGKKTIIYVPTSMDGNLRMAPYRNRSPSRAFDLERNIVKIFQEFPEYQFVVKLQATYLYPCSPIVEFVNDLKLRNTIVTTQPLTSLFPIADMFVTDYPSTTLLEMLTTDRPILFCGYELPWPWAPGIWHPSVLEMWRERVAYADDAEEFFEILRNHLREERFQAVRSNNTLLKLFGTHLDDGNSVDRAYAFLESLASGEMSASVSTEVQVEGVR